MNAKVTPLILAILIIFPLGAALEITAPQEDIVAETLPISVVLSWQGNSSSYQVQLSSDEQTYINATVNGNQQTTMLAAGEYDLSVTEGNSTARTTFNVQKEQEPLTLGVQTNKGSYDVGEVVEIQASSNRPTQATLKVVRDGTVTQSWDSLSISGSLNLLYPIQTAGTYTATLSSGQSTASTTWQAEQTQALEVDFSHSRPVLNKRTVLSAEVSGGVQPYEYDWSFSDESSVTDPEEEIEYYFLQTGPVDVTLSVTDAEGSTESITKTLDVQSGRYDLDITVLSQQNNPVPNITVQITDPQGTIRQNSTTLDSAVVSFFDLDAGSYQIQLSDAQEQYLTDSLTLQEDTSKVYTIQTQAGEDTINATQSGDQTENATQQNNETDVPPEPAELQAQQTTQEELQAQAQQQELQERRVKAREQLQQRELNFKLDSNKDEVLKHLGYYKKITQAINQVSSAQNQQEIQQILNRAPEQVEIADSTQRDVRSNQEELDQAIDEFLQAQAITDEDEQEAYRYSIKKHHENISILEKSYTARITTGSQTETHSVLKKEIQAPQGSRYIEVVSTDFVTRARDIQSQQRYDTLRENPVLEFYDDTYMYSAQKDSPAQSTTLIVPETVQDPPGALSSITGMVGISFEAGDAKKAVIYLIIIVFSVAGVAVGKRMYEPGETHIDSFCELTGQALDELQNGNAHAVAQIAPEIYELHGQLSKPDQQQSKEIVDHLKTEVTKHHFQQALNHVYRVGEEADINTLSAAYEEVMHIFEQLPETDQAQMQEDIHKLEAYVDKQIP